MAGSDPALMTAFQDRVGGDQRTVLEDADLLGERVHLHRPPSRRVRHAVEVAAYAHHALVRDPPLQAQDRPERCQRQRLQSRLLFGQGLVDDPLRGGVPPRVGHRAEPGAQLGIEVVEVARAAGEEKVLTDVSERPFDLPLWTPRKTCGDAAGVMIRCPRWGGWRG